VHELLRAVPRRLRLVGLEQFRDASTSRPIAMVPGTLCACSVVRFKSGGENLAVRIRSQRMLPPIAVVFPICLLVAAFQRYLVRGISPGAVKG
jgi:ABC-type glycerol-3-phosphate transport system permease component